MPGFSRDLNQRYSKQWVSEMKGEGYGNFANKRHSVVIHEPNKKSRKPKMKTKDSQRKKSKKY